MSAVIVNRRREKPVENYLLNACRTQSLLCFKFISPARGGVPDRVVISPGRTVFVEVKRPGEGPDPRQKRMHAKIRRHGGEVFIVDDKKSVDALIADLLATAVGTSQKGQTA